MPKQIHELPSSVPRPVGQPEDPWAVLDEVPGLATVMQERGIKPLAESAGTLTGERWKAWVKAHPGEFSASVPHAEPE
ncbi:MAG: hypothetical protein ABSE17_03335 [Candidatus Levyibacteriota bacterium]|jgi:hypothetical protein